MEWFREHAWETWLAVAMLLSLAELISMDLVLLMFAAGAVIGMIAAVLGLPLLAQAAVAAVGAIAMLLVVRPNIIKRLHGGPELRLGASKLIGMQGTCLTPISALEPGRIKVDGEEWTARPLDETLQIEAGEFVDILRIEGATAIVHPLPRLD